MLNFIESYVYIVIFELFLLVHLVSIGVGIYCEWGFFVHGIIFMCFIVLYVTAIATFEEEVKGYFLKYLFNSKLSLKHLKS